MYLENVKKGNQQEVKTEKKKAAKPAKPYEVTHTELEASNIIVHTDPDIPRDILKKCYNHFTKSECTRAARDVRWRRRVRACVQAHPASLRSRCT